ncbi:hypothetical protein Cgig2_008655 [Carnegiea gigantea]|uniref:Uncharacterized protein n=1 Tax=Carnegiea gigantea TaxID=171969 RepID=A0A9Q1JNU0_9CARY|nr:hypothetical protein Cgig2_008655 [Carnegiea gigantea]
MDIQPPFGTIRSPYLIVRTLGFDTLQRFPIESSYMPEVMKRLSLALQIHKISRSESKEKDKNWTKQQAESVGLILENSDSEEERVNKCKQRKAVSMSLKKLKEAGVSPVLQHQLEQLAQQKLGSDKNNGASKRKFVVIGQDCVEPLQALRKAGPEVISYLVTVDGAMA